ncbi:glycoside hydrolase [Cladorrhinum sp. PSN332]|nr:glycoside hydrolase [Cladorrhinum sp. PSN332]
MSCITQIKDFALFPVPALSVSETKLEVKMRVAKTSFAVALAAGQLVSGSPAHKRASCSSGCPTNGFKFVSAREWMKAADPGWNVGNSLDALPNEDSWNNPKLQESTFDHAKAAGFKSIRIPATYNDHYVSGSPEWKIDPTWLQRVSDVVHMATSRGFYVLTNIHHDSWNWADVSKPGANQTEIQEKFYASWLQIATKLKCESEKVAFEPINEPPGNNAEDGANLMKLNDLFLKALTDSGGFNARRVVTLSGPGMGADKIQWFKAQEKISNPWAFQFHFYNPYDFIFAAWGKTIWGSESDKAAATAELSSVREAFPDVPIVIGEFDASQLHLEPAARWKWFDHVVRTAKSLDMATMIWDNGLDNLQRETGIWRDKVAVDIILNASKGINNSLPDSTIDGNARTQTSSALIFNKAGSTPADQELPFLLNGNTFKSLTLGTGTPLRDGQDYTVSGSTLIVKQSFLSQYLSPEAAPGTKANITVEFSAGANSQIEIVQWDVPKFSSLSASASSVPSWSELQIPVQWKGLHRVAAVKIIRGDSNFLVDDWTVWLPPLQQGRGTMSSHWNFDHDKVMITRGGLDAVIASGQNATFTFEFFPRAEGNGNTVEFTLTV